MDSSIWIELQSKQLQNRYFALRHGISEANERGIIVSDPKSGVAGYGLSSKGRSDLAKKWPLKVLPFEPQKCIVFTSDFKRARETAEIFCRSHQILAPQVQERLRERFFGDLEGDSHDRYQEVWDKDGDDLNNHVHQCESTNEVAIRLASMLHELDYNNTRQNIVLSAHGDILQICQAILAGKAPNLHRSLPHMDNAELRQIYPVG